MPITNHVTSLELSTKLEALGVPQQSHFCWKVDQMKEVPPEVVYCLNGMLPLNGYNWRYNSAYLASELDQLIARATNGEYAFITNEEQTMGYRVYEPIMESEGLKLTRTGYKLEVIKSAGIMDENPADCRAKMLIHLLENHLISVEELGK